MKPAPEDALPPTGTAGPAPLLRAGDLDGLSAAEQRVLHHVVALAPALSPSPTARERMRARVLAAAADVEPGTTSTTSTTGPSTDHGTADEPDELARRRDRASRRGGARGRFLVAAAAALCLVVALSGISLVLSRDALPGDALYALKRAGETTQLELTFGDTDRGLRHLDNAARRVDELGALIDRGTTTAQGTAAATRADGVVLTAVEQLDPGTLGSLLDDLDAEAAAGSGLLTAAGVAGDGSALGALSDWARGQSARLVPLGPALGPDGSARLDGSLQVLTEVSGRADALASRLGCSPITSGTVDDLGPLPATTPCATAPDPSVSPLDATLTTPVAPSTGAADPGATDPGTTDRSTTVPGAPVDGSGGSPDRTGAPAATTPPATTPAAPAPTTAPPAGGGAVPTPALPTPALPTAGPPPITIPLPLLPPITLPPLLPGLPPITIGG